MLLPSNSEPFTAFYRPPPHLPGLPALGQEEKQIEVFVRKQLGEHCFYYRARGPLSALLTQPLLGTCVLQGNFCALAVNAPSDQGNSWAILPGGTLVLSLDRETFQARRNDNTLC